MNLICFGYDIWSTMWKRNQIMVSMLVASGLVERALFINPPIWVANVPARLRQQLSPLAVSSWHGAFGPMVCENLWSYTPVYWPKLASKGRARLWSRIRTFTRDPYLVLVNKLPDLPPDQQDDLYRNAKGLVVDWSDDFEQFCSSREEAAKFAKEFGAVVSRAEAVLCVNQGLHQKALQINRGAVLVRNATALPLIGNLIPAAAQPRWMSQPRSTGRRVVGYVGWLVGDRLDHKTIEVAARRLRTYDFFFVGPKVGREPIPRSATELPNVRIKGPVPFGAMGHLLGGLDVAILPNQINAHTKGNDPIKIYDYLYSGTPVVTTATEGVAPFKDLLDVRDNPESFADGVQRAIENDSPKAREERKAAGAENSWPVRFKLVESVFRDVVS